MGIIHRLPPWKINSLVKQLTESVDWGLFANNVPQHWKDTQGENIDVAVLDTGIELTHPDLKDAIKDAQDFSGSMFGPQDKNGHGTHTAGTIGARKNNIGVVGVAPNCNLLIGKVLGDDGSGSGDMVAKGILWAINKKAHIISMSLGSAYNDPQIFAAIQQAIQAGIIIICAAGNDGVDNSVNYPGKYTCAVSAYDKSFNLADFSSRGPEVIVSAPGVDIVSTFLLSQGGYASLSGTSMATPFVAGVVALYLALLKKNNTSLPNEDGIKNFLKAKSKDAGDPGFDPDYGWGLINPDSMLQLPTPVTPVVPVTPNPNPVEVIASFNVGDYIISITKQHK